MADDSGVTVTLSLKSPNNGHEPARRRLKLTPQSSKLVIGRSSKRHGTETMPLEDNAFFSSPVISRKHAELSIDPNSAYVFLKDTDSLHGTMVNGLKLVAFKKKDLRCGDEITIGSNVIHGDKEFLSRTFHVDYEWHNISDDDLHAETTSRESQTGFNAQRPNSNTPARFTVPSDSDDSDWNPRQEDFDDIDNIASDDEGSIHSDSYSRSDVEELKRLEECDPEPGSSEANPVTIEDDTPAAEIQFSGEKLMPSGTVTSKSQTSIPGLIVIDPPAELNTAIDEAQTSDEIRNDLEEGFYTLPDRESLSPYSKRAALSWEFENVQPETLQEADHTSFVAASKLDEHSGPPAQLDAFDDWGNDGFQKRSTPDREDSCQSWTFDKQEPKQTSLQTPDDTTTNKVTPLPRPSRFDVREVRNLPPLRAAPGDRQQPGSVLTGSDLFGYYKSIARRATTNNDVNMMGFSALHPRPTEHSMQPEYHPFFPVHGLNSNPYTRYHNCSTIEPPRFGCIPLPSNYSSTIPGLSTFDSVTKNDLGESASSYPPTVRPITALHGETKVRSSEITEKPTAPASLPYLELDENDVFAKTADSRPNKSLDDQAGEYDKVPRTATCYAFGYNLEESLGKRTYDGNTTDQKTISTEVHSENDQTAPRPDTCIEVEVSPHEQSTQNQSDEKQPLDSHSMQEEKNNENIPTTERNDADDANKAEDRTAHSETGTKRKFDEIDGARCNDGIASDVTESSVPATTKAGNLDSGSNKEDQPLADQIAEIRRKLESAYKGQVSFLKRKAKNEEHKRREAEKNIEPRPVKRPRLGTMSSLAIGVVAGGLGMLGGLIAMPQSYFG